MYDEPSMVKDLIASAFVLALTLSAVFLAEVAKEQSQYEECLTIWVSEDTCRTLIYGYPATKIDMRKRIGTKDQF